MTFQIPAYTNGSGEERERPEDDTHFGRCYGIVDMGTQNGGQYGPKRKLRLLFELSAENSEGERFLVHMEENMVISPKSNIGKAIGAWRGKPLDDSECKGAGFDITKVLGAAGMFTTNVRSTGTAKYTNIVGFAKVPKAVEVAPLIKETVVLNLAAFDPAEWAKLPGYMQKRIAGSPEGIALGLQANDAQAPAEAPEAPAEAVTPSQAAAADSCPF